MPPFICEFSKEMVILSDGNVTTCCLDPLAMNAFGNIYLESLQDIRQKHRAVYTSIAHEIEFMPRCRICYGKIKKSGIEKTATYTFNPSEDEVSCFINTINAEKIRLVIELSSLCNLTCNGCIRSRENITAYRKKPFLDVPALLSFLAPGLDRIGTIRLYNYGETFLHPEAIDFCAQIKILAPSVFIDIATNGMLLKDHEKQNQLVCSGVDEIYFSIHGASQKTVQKYMTKKFDFRLALEIMKSIQEIKKSIGTDKPRLVWKYLLFSWNDTDTEIQTARQLAEALAIDMAFTLPGYPSPSQRFSENPELLRSLSH